MKIIDKHYKTGLSLDKIIEGAKTLTDLAEGEKYVLEVSGYFALSITFSVALKLKDMYALEVKYIDIPPIRDKKEIEFFIYKESPPGEDSLPGKQALVELRVNVADQDRTASEDLIATDNSLNLLDRILQR